MTFQTTFAAFRLHDAIIKDIVNLLMSWPGLLGRSVKLQCVLGVHSCVYKLYHTFSVSFPSPGFSKGPAEGFASLRFLPK